MPSPDEQFWIGFGIGIVGIVLSIVISWYQLQVPSLQLTFNVPDGSPASLGCTISNTGRGQATDIALSFAFMLPVGTHVLSDAEVRAVLEEAFLPPDPLLGQNSARLQRAFAVRISRVAPGDSVYFELRTTDPDNLRAAEQTIRIRGEIERVLAEFGSRLSALDVEAAAHWKLSLIMSGRVKTDSMFTPAVLSYDKGRFSVSVLTPAEEEAAAWCQDLYAEFKPTLLEVFQGRPRFKAPVVRIKTLNGIRTYATFPPFVPTYVQGLVRKPQKGERMLLYPPVPESYA